MENSQTFLGEINLYKNILPDADFGDFSNLPNESLVHQLAAEFREHLELIPYQETGDPMQLSLAVYLRPISGNGRVIAILVKDLYPQDPVRVLDYIQLARKRIDLLKGLHHRITEQSIDSARLALEQLERRMVELLSQK